MNNDLRALTDTAYDRFMEKRNRVSEQAAKSKENSKKEVERAKRVEEAFQVISASEHGKRVFRELMYVLGFKKNSVVFNQDTQRMDTEATLYNEAMRAAYLEIRKYIPVEHLNEIEKEPLTDD